MNIPALVDAISALDIQPRKEQWRSVTSCAVDAVWSLSSNYDTVVYPLVRRLAAPGVDPIMEPGTSAPDPLPCSAFLERFPDEESLLATANNRQRTSSRNGITKAAATLQFVRVLADHGIETLSDAQIAMGDSARHAIVEADLRRIKGDGTESIRRNYFWMLVGADDLIKPDRMVKGWLQRYEPSVQTAADAVEAITRVCEDPRITHTPWEIDHAIWLAERALRQAEPRPARVSRMLH